MLQQGDNVKEPIVIVTACDDKYVRGAAAAVRSAIDSLSGRHPARVFVLDGGIAGKSKQQLSRSWASDRIEVKFLKPDVHAIRDMPVSEHISLSTYLRILMAEALPSDVSRAIYLDADTIVVRDLSELWKEPLDGMFCAATQDAFVPVLDPALVFDHPLHSMTLPNMESRPIPNYRELGLRFDAPYFNAGIMLANIQRWRKDEVARRAFQCLRDNAGKVRFWDQYALNVLFSDQWKIVDPRWNQNAQVYRINSCHLSHYSAEQFHQLRTDPWIIHFDYVPKPWDLHSTHPFRHMFFKNLDRTAWKGWRPRRTLREMATIPFQSSYSLYQGYRKWRQTHWSPAIRTLRRRLLGSKSTAA
jgi:lipopolysaccharide biosynthesis glycosyltransferase